MLFKEIDLPFQIDPCPIKEAIVEIHFESNDAKGAFINSIRADIKDEYPNVLEFPITKLPPEILYKDVDLHYEPHYKFSNLTTNYSLQIGPRMASLSISDNYVGWDDFVIHIEKIFKLIERKKIINKIVKISMRYIDFFNFNIFDDIVLHVNNTTGPLNEQINSLIKFSFEHNNVYLLLSIANGVKYNNDIGSIIDIDVFHKNISQDPEVFFSEYMGKLDDMHKSMKTLFFNLIDKKILEEKYHPTHHK